MDFTFDALIALFFANFEIDYKTAGFQPELPDIRSTDAAIYVINYETLKFTHFLKKYFWITNLQIPKTEHLKHPALFPHYPN